MFHHQIAFQVFSFFRSLFWLSSKCFIVLNFWITFHAANATHDINVKKEKVPPTIKQIFQTTLVVKWSKDFLSSAMICLLRILRLLYSSGLCCLSALWFKSIFFISLSNAILFNCLQVRIDGIPQNSNTRNRE